MWLNMMPLVKLKADTYNKYLKIKPVLSNMFKSETHWKGAEDNAQIVFQTTADLRNPVMNRMHFTVHPAGRKHCDFMGLNCWGLYCHKEKLHTYTLGEKGVRACLSSKYPLCLLVLRVLQNHVRFVTTEQTYVSTGHRVPAAKRCGCHRTEVPRRLRVLWAARLFVSPCIMLMSLLLLELSELP